MIGVMIEEIMFETMIGIRIGEDHMIEEMNTTMIGIGIGDLLQEDTTMIVVVVTDFLFHVKYIQSSNYHLLRVSRKMKSKPKRSYSGKNPLLRRL